MKLCVCGQTIESGDAFCAGCGKPSSAVAGPVACHTCGRQAPEATPFCSHCGASLVAAGSTTSAARRRFQWKWVLLTIPIVVGVALALMVLGGLCMAVMGVDPENGNTQSMVGALILLASMLFGGLVAGWLSPGRTVLEPGVGIAAALLGLNLALGDASGILLGWVLPFLIGAGGAWIGETLPKRSTASR